MRVVLITRPHLEETNRLVRKAAKQRGLPISPVDPCAPEDHSVSQKGPRLIYRATKDQRAGAIEKLLTRPGDALLHDPDFTCDQPAQRLVQAQIPIPRRVMVHGPEKDSLAAQVLFLGGWPIVVRPNGKPEMPSILMVTRLTDLIEQLDRCDYDATIESYIPHDRCWKITVLGDRVLAASVSRAPDEEFNLPGSSDYCDTSPDAPPEAADHFARNAARALRKDFGAAHMLEGPNGKLTLLKFEFPCAFADQQKHCKVDIAGHMLEHLASKLG
ncbi:MAG: RimK family alpha-L-glutamate ligase [Paracoccaceae bacterium]